MAETGAVTHAGLTVSPDGEWMRFTNTEIAVDVMFVEGLSEHARTRSPPRQPTLPTTPTSGS